MWIIATLCFVSLIATLHYVLLQVPFEATQGAVQKIFYFHVPAAFSLYLFASLGVIFSIIYLIQRQRIFDAWARSSFYTATFFGSIVLVSGPLWAKPIWGVYWTWDPRLTLSFALFILLLGYCFVRRAYSDSPDNQHRGAVIGSILGVLTVPFMILTHLSVKIWRGLHPSVLSKPDGLEPEFRLAFEMGLLAFFIFGVFALLVIQNTQALADRVQELESRRARKLD
jgi:heme exporter protein C